MSGSAEAQFIGDPNTLNGSILSICHQDCNDCLVAVASYARGVFDSLVLGATGASAGADAAEIIASTNDFLNNLDCCRCNKNCCTSNYALSAIATAYAGAISLAVSTSAITGVDPTALIDTLRTVRSLLVKFVVCR